MADSFFFRARRGLDEDLEQARRDIEKIARNYGLDFFDTVFEVCDYDEINMLAAYGGFPTRYPHWKWGMEYLQMQKGYEYGLQKIYEMVINTEPSYAYLLDNNMMVDQKLVMAHVFGHVDFFKNNMWFSPTNRKMLDQMANHAVRIQRHMDVEGRDTVEKWLDICLSLDNLIDPHLPFTPRQKRAQEQAAAPVSPGRLPARDYMDRHINPPDVLEQARIEAAAAQQTQRGTPAEPQRDVLLFLLEHAPLRAWQRDVLSIVRDESYYFLPQGQTKIMNEGWASYWHTTIMTHDVLTAAEVVDYADHHAGTVATRPGQLNPYKLGLELFRDIEERWNRGQFGAEYRECDDPRERARWNTHAMQGRQKLFEVRKTHNDVTFLDEFLTEEFVREQGIVVWDKDKRTGKYKVGSDDFKAIKQQLLFMLSNRGQPRLRVLDANHANRGELVLGHQHEGMDLDLQWAERALGNLQRVWSRPVLVKTELDGKPVWLRHDGTDFSQEARSAA